MDQTLKKMKNQGYMVFVDKKESVAIEKGNLKEISIKLDEIKTVSTQWSEKVSNLHGYSSEATMFKGPKLR
jgi:hypothetical protein